MRIDNPATLAQSCRTATQAARAAASLEAEISLGERSEEWYAAADDALDALGRRFPGHRRLDAYRQAPTLSPAARRELATTEPAPTRLWERLLEDLLIGAGVLGALWEMRRHPLLLAFLPLTIALAVVVVLVRLAGRHPRIALGVGVAIVLAYAGPVIFTLGALLAAGALAYRRGWIPARTR